jgi:hypothetical protein
MKFRVWNQTQSTSLIPILYILQLTKPLLCLACPCSNIMLAILPSILMLPLHPSNNHNYQSPLMNCTHYHNIHTSTNIEERFIRKNTQTYCSVQDFAWSNSSKALSRLWDILQNAHFHNIFTFTLNDGQQLPCPIDFNPFQYKIPHSFILSKHGLQP